ILTIMTLDDLILTDDICTHYHVHETFIRALDESEIIHLKTIERKRYLPVDEIKEFEKMRRLHYQMDINLVGLEAIKNLLETIKDLQREKRRLENRLRLYE